MTLFKKFSNLLYQIIFGGFILTILITTSIKEVYSSESSVAIGFGHYLALKEDGSLCSWGNNDYGQLGDGTKTSKSGAVQIDNLVNVKAIAAGKYHSVALTHYGFVYAWGANDYGQLGDGTTTIRTSPRLLNIDNIKSIAAGDYHTVALTYSGDVWTWGKNDSGQLGNGSNANSYNPEQLNYLDFHNIIGIAAGREHNIALKEDGTIWTWGSNSSNSSTPTQMKNFQNIIQIASGANNSLALKNDGTVWEIFHDTNNVNDPVQVDELDDVKNIFAGGWDFIAVKTNDSVWSWGTGAKYCQQSEVLPFLRSYPLQIDFIDNIKNISSGYIPWGYGSTNSTIFIKNDGYVWALEDDEGIKNPTQVKNLKDIKTISTGDSVAAAQDSDHVWIWGQNLYGPYNHIYYAPICQTNLTNVKTISAGSVQLFWVNENESLWGWGGGWEGADNLWGINYLGYNEPTLIHTFDTIINKITASGDTAFAIDNNGNVWVWGSNKYGKFGNGTNESGSNIPVKINNISNVISLSSVSDHVIALKNDGTVWGWGNNGYGQLGIGSTENHYVPTQITDLENIKRIDTGGGYSVALKEDGTVWTWGNNYFGQLGNGTNQDSNVPIMVENLTNVKDISSGRYITLALKEDGNVWSWGQFGEASTIHNNKTPSKVENLSNVKDIKASLLFALALKEDGTVWAWGYSRWLGKGIPLKQIKDANGSLLRLSNQSNECVWDIDINKKWSLPDIIYGLQVLSGVK